MAAGNRLMISVCSVADIFMLFVACSFVIPGLGEMNSPISAQNLQHGLLNDNGTVNLPIEIDSQVVSCLSKLAECSEINKEYNKRLITQENHVLSLSNDQVECQLNLTNKQHEIEILKESIETSQKSLVESADSFKTLLSISKFNESNVPDDLLEKRRHLYDNIKNESQAVIVDVLKKWFDDIALTSNYESFNKYFCNKKCSYYDPTICKCFNEKFHCQIINMSRRNLSFLPEDIFNNCGNLETLYLNQNRLKFLPPGIFNNVSKLRILWLQENHLTSLPEDIFSGLKNLNYLYLPNNRLSYLESGIFNDLSNLKDLRLGVNHLTTLPEDIFKGLKELNILSFVHNQLNYLYPSTFNGLIKLKHLALQYNDLTTLPHGIFNDLEELDILKLHYNRLTHLDFDTFNNIPKLSNLSIHDNNLTEDSKNMLKELSNSKNFKLHL